MTKFLFRFEQIPIFCKYTKKIRTYVSPDPYLHLMSIYHPFTITFTVTPLE